MRRRFLNVLKLTLVLGLSLLLLLFVGNGEARRTYPLFQIEKLAAEAEIARNPIESFLRTDFPLEQFPGFNSLAQPLLETDPIIYAIYVTDQNDDIVFVNFAPGNENINASIDQDRFVKSTYQPETARFRVTETTSLYQVSLDLNSRFGIVGALNISMLKTDVDNIIDEGLLVARISMAGILLLFVFYLLLTSRALEKPGEEVWDSRQTRRLSLMYALSYLVVAIIMIASLISLYVNGIAARSEALADSLAQRLNQAYTLGLDIGDFRDLDSLFNDYLETNPDLSYVTLVENGRVILSSEEDKLNKEWASPENHFDYSSILSQTSNSSGQVASLHLGVPTSVIYQSLWRSTKNFAMLFIASAFLTSIFFSLIRAQSSQPQLVPGTLHTKRGYLLALIGPAFFLLIFVTNGLPLSFLPNFLGDIIDSSASAQKVSVSTLYTIRYLFIALALLISGSIAERRGSRLLLLLGGVLVFGAMMLLVFAPRYEVLIGVQAMLGFGEGMFLIAVQSYILRVATASQRTKGAAMLVNNTYGGALSGTAIGALLVIDPRIQASGVFFIGGLVIIFLLLYILRIIPSLTGEDFSQGDDLIKAEEPQKEYGTVILSKEELKKAYDISDTDLEFDRSALSATMTKEQKKAEAITKRSGLLAALTDLEFLKTAILIGIPVKIVWTGVFNANLPIILDRQNFPTEDVSQIMMLYIAGVLITSSIIARITDWLGKTKLVLFLGALGSGIGLLLIGLLGSEEVVAFIGQFANEQTTISVSQNVTILGTLLLIIGMTILGFSHGFIQAPIITHVAKTEAADKLGKSAVASLYRLFERAGQVLGPILVGAMLVANDYSILTVSIIGIFVFAFGLLFLLPSSLRRKSVAQSPTPAK